MASVPRLAFRFPTKGQSSGGSRIPKKAGIKPKEEARGFSGELDGGTILQLLGCVEIDIVQRILTQLDPVSLMSVEMTGSSLRQFVISHNTWKTKAARESSLSLPAVKARCLQLEASIPDHLQPVTEHLKYKAKTVRAWNLSLNWDLGQTKLQQLLAFNCNHEGCGERCALKLRTILNPTNPQVEDLLPSQVIAGDLVVVNTFNQYTTDDGRIVFYSIKFDRKIEVFEPTEVATSYSLVEAPLNHDRSKIGVLYYVPGVGDQIQLKFVLLEAATYNVLVRIDLPNVPGLNRQVFIRPGEGDLCFLEDKLLFFLHDTLTVIDPHISEDNSVIKAVINVPRLIGFKVNITGKYLYGLQPKQAVVFAFNQSESTVTEVWRKTFSGTSFPPINLTSLGLAFPFLYVGKSHGDLETWNVVTNELLSQFDKTEIIVSPRPGIHDVKILADKVLTTNFGDHLCVWDREVLEGRQSRAPGYKLEIKFEQDFYADETQLVFIEEMGDRDMEMMNVSRLDFWAIAKKNVEMAKKGQQKTVEMTYGKLKRKRDMDPRKRKIDNTGRKIGNAGLKGVKKPSLDVDAAMNSLNEVEDNIDEDYDFREDDLLVDDHEFDRDQEEQEYEDALYEDDYDYQDGDGLV